MYNVMSVYISSLSSYIYVGHSLNLNLSSWKGIVGQRDYNNDNFRCGLLSNIPSLSDVYMARLDTFMAAVFSIYILIFIRKIQCKHRSHNAVLLPCIVPPL